MQRVTGQCSVTRFGKISPPSKNLKVFGPFLEGLFSIGENVEPTLGKIYAFGQISIVVYGQILSKQSSHLVTLQQAQMRHQS